jgi:hypothetical protein
MLRSLPKTMPKALLSKALRSKALLPRALRTFLQQLLLTLAKINGVYFPVDCLLKKECVSKAIIFRIAKDPGENTL